MLIFLLSHFFCFIYYKQRCLILNYVYIYCDFNVQRKYLAIHKKYYIKIINNKGKYLNKYLCISIKKKTY